jgi:hypothetical protein
MKDITKSIYLTFTNLKGTLCQSVAYSPKDAAARLKKLLEQGITQVEVKKA